MLKALLFIHLVINFQYISHMKYVGVICIAFGLIFGISVRSNAQQDTAVLQKIVSVTQQLDNEYPPEKVYLHFDKPYYVVGDTIWFKGYVTEGQNQPSELSKILYVEILTKADSLVQVLKLPVVHGNAAGNLLVDKEHFAHGNYYVRAYTLWMTNFDPDFFFYKSISIGEAVDRQVRTNIQFISSSDNKVDAKISFKDGSGKSYGGKQVNWQIITNFDEVARGRGTTDAGGILRVSIPNDAKKSPLDPTSKLVAQLVAVEKEDPITTAFSLRDVRLTNDIQFFPEGGEFIEGVPLQIGFKSIRSNGLGLPAKGKILDNLGAVIAEFATQHAGMGGFYMTMEPQKKYRAMVTFEDGSTKEINLPAARSSAVAVLANNKNPDYVDVKVASSIEYLEQNKDKKIYLIAQNNGVVYFAAQGLLQKQIFNARIPKNKLPDGVLQLALFSDQGIPLSERLIFIRNKQSLNLSIKADKPTYGIKQKVVLSIRATDSVKSAVSNANLSLSVVDETKVPVNENRETTILSSLLLTSDLQGYVEQPNYYFVGTNEKKLAELDHLMLTQGYRRFSYAELMKNHFPQTTVLPEQGIVISGTLRNKTGLPINKGTVLLTIPEKRYNKQILTSAVGGFVFGGLNFDDLNQVTINAKYNPNPNNLMILVNGMPEAAIGKNKNAADDVLNIDSSMTNYLNNSAKQYQFMRTIKEVSISQKSKKVSHQDHPALSSLPMLADHTVSAETFKLCTMLSDCLKSKLPGVTYYENNLYRSRDFNAGGRTPMAIYMNGLLIDFSGTDLVSAVDLESIEIFLNDPIGTIDRANGTKGVIVLNVKPQAQMKGNKITAEDLKKLIPESYLVTFKPRGYSVSREFYVPKYPVDPAALNFTDLRTTVYWNPKLTTDAQGNATVEFYNADGRGSYRAVLEGNDAKGNVGRTVFRYTVK